MIAAILYSPTLPAVILMFIFDVDVFTTSERGTFGGVLSLMFLFGPAAASFAYFISFFFSSASLCNIFIIMIGFLTGLGGPITTYTLRLIGSDPNDPWEKLMFIARVVEWIGRLFPSFCLGKGLFYTMYISTFELRSSKKVSVWDKEVLLFEVIALALQSVVYLILAVNLEKCYGLPEIKLFCDKLVSRCNHSYSACDADDDLVCDDDVLAEEELVLSDNSEDDAVVFKELRKVYGNGKVAIKNLSLGIPAGECFGLLGTNGSYSGTIPVKFV